MIERYLSRYWLLVAVGGLLTLVLGALLMIWPDFGMRVLVFVFGIYALIFGAAGLIIGGYLPAYRANRPLYLVIGAMSLIIGLLALGQPIATAFSIVYLSALSFILSGSFQFILTCWYLREWSHLLAFSATALAEIGYGVFLVLNPLEGMRSLAWLTGLLSFAVGMIYCAFALDLRKQ